MKYLYKDEKILLGVLIGIFLVSVISMLFLYKNPIHKQIKFIPNNQEKSNQEKSNQEKSNQKVAKIIDTNKGASGIDNITLANSVAKMIETDYPNYGGFIIVCKPEKLLKLSAFLSFMLENLGKPVVFTDSERVPKAKPLIEKSDVPPKVMILSKDGLVAACHVIMNKQGKIISKNNKKISENDVYTIPTEKFQVKFLDNKINILALRKNRNITEKILEHEFNQKNIKAVIIEKNIKLNSNILKFLSFVAKNGVIVTLVRDPTSNTTPIEGSNTKLSKLGIIDCGDINTDIMYAKLMYLCSHISDPDILSKLVLKNFREEISDDDSE